MVGILVQEKKEGKRRKSAVLATVGYTAVLFGVIPLSRKWERKSASCRFWCCRLLDAVGTPPGLSPSAGSPVEKNREKKYLNW